MSGEKKKWGRGEKLGFLGGNNERKWDAVVEANEDCLDN
jgi:hypothetical protein